MWVGALWTEGEGRFILDVLSLWLLKLSMFIGDPWLFLVSSISIVKEAVRDQIFTDGLRTVRRTFDYCDYRDI